MQVKRKSLNKLFILFLLSLFIFGGVMMTNGAKASAAEGELAVSIDQTIDSELPKPGETVKYTVRVTNNDTESFVGVASDGSGVATVDLSGALEHASFVETDGDGALSPDGQEITWFQEINPDETATFTYALTINDDAEPGAELTTTATLPETGDNDRTVISDPADGVVVSSVVAGAEIVNPLPPITINPPADVPFLEIDHVADAMTPAPGDAIKYTVTVKNPAVTAAPLEEEEKAAYQGTVDVNLSEAAVNNATLDKESVSAVVNDPGDDASSPDSGENGTVNTDDRGKLVWDGSIPAGGELILTYRLEVNDDAENGAKLLSTAEIPDGAQKQVAPGEATPVVAFKNPEDPNEEGNGLKAASGNSLANTGANGTAMIVAAALGLLGTAGGGTAIYLNRRRKV